jgi:hypothetical protein
VFASIAKFRYTRPLTTADFEANERVIVPLLKGQSGYQGYLEISAGEHETIAVTLWASQADAERGLAAIRPQLVDLIGSAMDGPPERSVGEVVYVDLPH